jgi:hypothetical protein
MPIGAIRWRPAASASSPALFAGLIQRRIQTLITFDGRLTRWRVKSFIGALLFVFIVAQRAISKSTKAGRSLA